MVNRAVVPRSRDSGVGMTPFREFRPLAVRLRRLDGPSHEADRSDRVGAYAAARRWPRSPTVTGRNCTKARSHADRSETRRGATSFKLSLGVDVTGGFSGSRAVGATGARRCGSRSATRIADRRPRWRSPGRARPRDLPFDLTIGVRLELMCWGGCRAGCCGIRYGCARLAELLHLGYYQMGPCMRTATRRRRSRRVLEAVQPRRGSRQGLARQIRRRYFPPAAPCLAVPCDGQRQSERVSHERSFLRRGAGRVESCPLVSISPRLSSHRSRESAPGTPAMG